MSTPMEKHIGTKMRPNEAYLYAVVHFLERPRLNIDDYICIPHSWIRIRKATDRGGNIVSIIAFPDEDPLVTERRILKNEKASETFKLYTAIVKYETSYYEDAKNFMLMMKKNETVTANESANDDHEIVPVPTSVRSSSMDRPQLPESHKNINNRKQMNAFDSTRPLRQMVKSCKPDLESNITFVVPPISIKSLDSEDREKIMEETEKYLGATKDNFTSINNNQCNSNYLFQQNHNYPHNDIVSESHNQTVIVSPESSSQIAHNKLCRPQHPLILKQLLINNFELPQKPQEYVSLMRQIQTTPDLARSQINNSDLRPTVIENRNNVVEQSKQIFELPLEQKLSPEKMSDEPFDSHNNAMADLPNVVACPNEIIQLDGAEASPMEDESGLSEDQKSCLQTNQSFDSQLNMWINQSADLFQMMHTNLSNAKMLSLEMHKSLAEKTENFKYFTNLFDNLRKLTKRNTNVDELDVENIDERKCDMEGKKENYDEEDSKTESTKGAIDVDGDEQLKNCKENVYLEDQRDRNIIRKFVLPPEYDANDTRWTLKYREYDPEIGIVELVPDSNVFIDAVRLAHCKRVSKDSKSLARMLLIEIFTRSALSVCSLTGAKANAFYRSTEQVRPGLDQQAIMAIMSFVERFSVENKWAAFDHQIVTNTLRSKIQDVRGKYGKVA